MSIIDSSPKPKNITLHNGASISTTKSRFGGGSLFLDGSNKYASIPDHTDFGFGTGDFTIEMWVYPVDRNNWKTLISLGTHTNGLLWRIGTGGDQLYFNGTYWDWGASSVPLNSWSHLALVRSSGTIKVFINGNQSFSNNSSAAGSDLGSSRAVNIGAYNPGSETFNGYLDEIRITKGIGSARYSSNFDIKTLLAPFPSSGTTITPPEAISNLSTLARDQRIDLQWTVPTEDNGGIITDYSFQYSTDDPTNNPTYYEYSHSPSTASSGSILGLVNGTTYSVRVAPINIAGTGSYVTSTGIIPILPPALSIAQEPLNNRVTTNSEVASFSVSGELTNNTNNSTFSYQWQKYSLDFNDSNYKWTNIDNGTSSTITLTPNDFPSYYDPDATGPVRCLLTSPYETKTSKTVRLVNVGSVLGAFSYYPNWDYLTSNGGTVGGNYYDSYSYNSNQRISLYLDYYGYYYNYNDSWYTGNDTKLKFQYSLDGSSWSDVDSAYNYNFRRNNYSNNFQTPSIDLSGRVYFRAIVEDLWPYTTNDGTNSTSESSYSRIFYYYWVDYTPSVPGAPSNVVADPGNDLVTVSWNAPTITGGVATSSYTVQYSANGGSWITFGTSSTTSLVVSELFNGTNYVFRVAASNSAGTGSYSSPSPSVTPDLSYATTPGVPTNITGIAGNTKVLLNWVVPSDIGKSVLTDYVVQLSTDDGETWENYVEPTQTPSTSETPTMTPTPTPTPTPPPAFYNFNTQWNTVGFSGSGTLSNKYTAASVAQGSVDGPNGISAKVSAAGTVYITAGSVSTDFMYEIKRNTTTVFTAGDSNGYFTNNFSTSFSVSANDTISIGVDSDQATYTNLQIWWTA